MSTPAPPWHDDLLTLYRQRYAQMVRVAYLLTGSTAVAEELVQDAFVAVFRNWEHARSPAAYLRTAVVNNCRSWLRRRARERQRGNRVRPDDAHLHADELWDALGRLPARQRAALVLRFYEDLPDAEVATILGCREPTVRTAIHRGLAALRKEIER